ncbi:MAG: hypothetical protein RI913_692 [Pseudomonadota bacterium]|jgi:hypothetical protein
MTLHELIVLSNLTMLKLWDEAEELMETTCH